MILPFDKFSKNDLLVVGGKAANLGELIQNGFPVPNGIVITTNVYSQFIVDNNLQPRIDAALQSIDYSIPTSIEEASALIKTAIRTGTLPTELTRSIEKEKALLESNIAIRSSATAEDLPTASFAGQQDSFLHIRGIEKILHFIRECYSSLWSTRAIAYRNQNNIPHKDVKIAVILQQMVSAISAGVLFTANPISLDRNELLIESVFGLGEALVSGQVSPDQFVVKHKGKKKFEILTREISSKKMKIEEGEDGTKSVLLSDEEKLKSSISDKQVLEIAKLGFSVERHYKTPQDIEWAFDESNKLYLTQTRPITSILALPEKDDEVWTRGYSDDYWNDPTSPLFFDLLGTQLTLIVNVELNRIMGYPKISDKFLRLSHGHVYFNLDVLKHKCEYEIPTFLRNDDILNYFPSGKGKFGKQTMRQQPFRLGKRIFAEIRVMLHDNSNGSILKTATNYEQWTHNVFWPFCDSFDSNLIKISGGSEVDPLIQLGDLMEHTMAVGHYRMVRYGIPVHNIGMNLMAQYLLKRFMGKKLATALYPVLISGLEHKVSETNERIQILAAIIRKYPILKDLILGEKSSNFYDLISQSSDKAIKNFKTEFDKFLAEFGDRGFTREMYYPRWGESPEFVVDILKSLVIDYDKDTAEQRRKITDYRNKVENFVALRIRSSAFGLLKYKLFMAILSLARTYIIFRENQRFNLDKWITRVRSLYLEIGEIFNKNGILQAKEDIFFLHKSEIRKLAAQSLSAGEERKISILVKKRKEMFLKYEFTIPPKFIQGNREFDDPIRSTKGRNFKGISASQGIITARVRVLTNIKQISEVKAGEILIVPKTDPGWTPIFAKIGGLITETGGILSHGAVVSREYGIPAVTNIFNACKTFKTGMVIKLDGTNGFVKILSEKEKD